MECPKCGHQFVIRNWRLEKDMIYGINFNRTSMPTEATKALPMYLKIYPPDGSKPIKTRLAGATQSEACLKMMIFQATNGRRIVKDLKGKKGWYGIYTY